MGEEKINIQIPIRDQLAGILRSRIIEGVYTSGQKLVERDLSKEFDVSPTPVKEALRMLEAEQLVLFRLVDMVHIGDVGHPAAVVVGQAEAEHRQVLVHTPHGHDLDIADAEGAAVADIVECGFGQARILVIVKDIMVVVANCCQSFAVGVDVHIALLHPVEGPYVVESAHVVAVGVSDKDTLKVAHIVGEHLRPEVGTDVDEDVVAAAVGDEGSRAQSLVVLVVREADIASASDDGDTLRCSCTQKSDEHYNEKSLVIAKNKPITMRSKNGSQSGS